MQDFWVELLKGSRNRGFEKLVFYCNNDVTMFGAFAIICIAFNR